MPASDMQATLLKASAVVATSAVAYGVYTCARLWMVNRRALPDLPPEKAAHLENILKKGYRRKDVPQDLDCIVIGSGLGGLTSASLLARMGKRVLVLEAHDVAGGCTHTFTERGYEMDTGLHYVGSMQPERKSFDRRLFDYISDGKLEWESLGSSYDVVVLEDGTTYEWVVGADNNIARLSERFPEDADKIKEFFRATQQASKSFGDVFNARMLPAWLGWLLKPYLLRRFRKFNSISPLAFVKSLHLKNKQLESILLYIYGDYGTSVDEGSLAMHSATMWHYLKAGAFYPVGGSSEIPKTIIPVIRRAGGQVMVRAEVAEIVVENGTAVGVRMAKDDNVIRAPMVISSAGVHATFQKLLPSQGPSNLPENTQHPAGVGHCYLFLGFNKSNSDLKLPTTNIWSVKGGDLADEHHRLFGSSTPPENLNGACFVGFPSAKDPTWDKRFPGKSTCIVIYPAPFAWFEKFIDQKVRHREAEYEDLKKRLHKVMFDCVQRHYPHITPDVVAYSEVGTPASNNFYLGRTAGDSYGLEHNPSRFEDLSLRPPTHIKGLYLTGQDIVTAGITSALVSGMLTVMSATGRLVPKDVLEFGKK